MILSDRDILREIGRGNIKIEPFDKRYLGSASYDLSLSDTFWFFKDNIEKIDLEKDWKEYMEELKTPQVLLKPKSICLGLTQEKIMLADHIAGKLEGRSRFARLGLAVHITSSFVQPGVYNHQVLEIVNNSPFPILLKKGLRISQIIFYYVKSPTLKPYRQYGFIAKDQ